ncbi:MAG TPA: hypothetical protein DEQ40_08410 [Oxalobacteraceae bacterium]|nr:hypothetical protein [Oxalobacteraceae bacterium]
MTCIYAWTAMTQQSYPDYVSVNERNGGVEITVRSPAKDGVCGQSAASTITKDEALDLARAILEKYGTL